jgi:hypothetical protein
MISSAGSNESVSESSDPHGSLKGPYPDGPSVTKDCLECHTDEAKEILHSAHWLWKGPSPFVEGNEDRRDLGKRNLINNF